MKAVVDTNVIVSAVLSATAAPAGVLTAWRQGRFDLAVSPPLLAEYRRALAYERVRRIHGLSDDELDGIVERFSLFAIVVEPVLEIDAVTDDPDDNRVLECAVTAAVEVIVTGDKHLRAIGVFRGIRVLSPAEFLVHLNDVEGES
jgi:putative PIN family toxin of toxin-antitoxin system